MERKRNRTAERQAITSFFDWFMPDIDKIFENFDFQDAVTKRLKAINPDIRWEAGPWDGEKNFFAFSPNLNRSNFELTALLRGSAPSIPGWVFLASKPRKKWNSRVIKIRNNEGVTTEYNIDEWSYYLTSFNDGEFFDVNLIPHGDESVSIDDLEYIGSLFVEFELGEEVYMELIDRVNIVLPPYLSVPTNKLENLYPQIMDERLMDSSLKN